MSRITIIGAGGWGTALGIAAARAGNSVRLWSRNPEVVDEINRQHINSVYLAPHKIPETVSATTDTAEALAGAEIVILASPSHATRELLMRMLTDLKPGMLFVSATKGIENETCFRVSEMLGDVLRERFSPRFVCLSGPSFAQE